MVGIDVRCYFENEAGEFVFLRCDGAFFGINGLGRRCYLHKTIQQFLDAKVVQCGTKKHWRKLPVANGVQIEFVAGTIQKFNVVLQRTAEALSDQTVQLLGLIQRAGDGLNAVLTAMGFRKGQDLLLLPVIDPFEIDAAANRPMG